jgi:hypothetical protein
MWSGLIRVSGTLHQTLWGEQQAPHAANRRVAELLLYLAHPTRTVRQHVIVEKENYVATSTPCTSIALLGEVEWFIEIFKNYFGECRKRLSDFLWGMCICHHNDLVKCTYFCAKAFQEFQYKILHCAINKH